MTRSIVPPSVVCVALLYCRVSSEEQARDGLSLEAQKTRTRQYALQRGWIIGGEYADVLAGTRVDRPHYQALLAEARRLRASGKPVVVVVTWLDRFGRSVFERARSAEELRKLRVPIHSVMEGGEVPEFVANVLAAVAEEEVRHLSERLREVRRFVLANGWTYPGRPAWGYLRRPATLDERQCGAPRSVLIVDPLRAPYVQAVWERVAAGEAVHAVARWVQQLPDEIRGGRFMSEQTIQRLLRAPVYIARHVVGEDNVLARPLGRWPALIADEIWQRARGQLGRGRPRKLRRRHLLSSLLRCPTCGGQMAGHHLTRQAPRYSCVERLRGAVAPRSDCRTSVLAPPIEALVLSEVLPMVAALASREPERLRALEQLWLSSGQLEGHSVERQRWQQTTASAHQAWAAAALLLVDGVVGRAEYARLREEARQRMEGVEGAMGAFREAQRAPALPPLADVLQQAPHWSSILQGEDTLAKRDVLARFITDVRPERLAIGHYRVVINRTPLGAILRRWGRQMSATTPASPDPSVAFDQADGEHADGGPIAARRRIRRGTERLRQLPRTAFDVLPEPDRSIVLRYHGLPDGIPQSQTMLACCFGLKRGQVIRVLKESLRRLLGTEAPTIRFADSARKSGRGHEALLRSLPQSVFDSLPQPERTIIELYYGLGDGNRRRQEEIAARLSLSRYRVRFLLRQTLLRLLGEETLAADGALITACVICTASIARTSAMVRAGRGKVCSTACLRELQRRKSLVADHPMRTAAARLRTKESLARRDREPQAHRPGRLEARCRHSKRADSALGTLLTEA